MDAWNEGGKVYLVQQTEQGTMGGCLEVQLGCENIVLGIQPGSKLRC